MTYQVLARKWRPKSFASLVGQEHVVRALTHALDGGRLHHAYLFTGTRGVGKTTLSRIFAKALNCETGVTSTPCGVCRACKEIDEGRFVDYVEMDAASNRGVDEMAALLERAVYAPVDARFKVYMIDEVHMLTNHAFNAMLKTLEEPPAHVKFILATTDPQKIPVTVLSRCLQFNLKQMPAGHIVGHLEHVLGEEKIPYEPQALRLLSRAADGSMRDALSLTDQAIAYSANQVTEEAVRGMLGALDQSYLIRLLDTLAAGDGQGVLGIADEMALRSLSFSTALQDLAGLLHRIAWAQFAPASVLDEWPEAADIRRFADLLSAEHVQLFYQIATIGRGEMGLAPDEYAGFTMTLLRMLAFEPAGGPGGGGGGGARVRPVVAGSSGAGTRESTPSGVAAGAAGSSSAGAAKPVMNRVADVASKGAAAPASDRVKTPLSNDASQAVVFERSVAGEGRGLASASTPELLEGLAASSNEGVVVEPAPAQTAGVIDNTAVSLPRETLGAGREAAADVGGVDTANAEEGVAGASSASTVISAGPDLPEPTDLSAAPQPSTDTPSSLADVDESAIPAFEPDTNPASLAVPLHELAERAVADRTENQAVPPAEKSVSPRAPGGASAALDVLRSAGMRVSSDRGVRAPEPVRKPVAPKATPTVQVPVPRRPAASPDRSAAPAAGESRSGSNQQSASAGNASGSGAVASRNTGGATPPWEEMPLDDYQPVSSEEGYFMPPDDGFMPAFDSGPDDLRFNDAPAAKPALKVDARPLPPAVPLDVIGVSGDWPSLAVDLPLKGIAYQLAFNSELTACDAASITLTVPVPQYAESAQVAKLKAALADKLGRPLEVSVSVGPTRRTAAALDAAARAERQQQAEQEITQNPFVQSLIRDFGASIVQGSIKPLASDSAKGGGQNAASMN
ncbi:DNA polymerase III subunit gamma/tau [Caballeronia sp. SEWSISQ10-4 2]|uniref:DNA polymerase III subunit gamma/tau n=1 Tax=Caballeronia sp. SEWSISQ10-4 2 TaxID=2937438 RepID=UPI0026525DF1|nr:DNA polymerase III subunit gamma/tau [Caballeronia sp. SEWSISQ10-4 2]MDN7182084.1 DNA polymerase III subunit gamma/tau [Caballeronia sp. SEWSISQ10-4 2]